MARMRRITASPHPPYRAGSQWPEVALGQPPTQYPCALQAIALGKEIRACERV